MNERYNLDTIAIQARYWRDSEYFASTDSEAEFTKNLITMPADWPYRTKEIRYDVNSLGYRTKEFDDINQNNFFIAYGCSFTYGVGLAEDEIWTSTVANELGIECLNLGMGACGMDYICLNTMTYLKNTDVKPKFVVIQGPEPARMIMRSLDAFEMLGPNFSKHNMFEQEIKNNSHLYNTYLAWHNTMTFWKTANVPVYFWSMNRNWGEIIPNIKFDYYWPTSEEMMEPKDRARDLMHFPAGWQIRTGKGIAQKLRNDPKFGIGTVDNL
jgi:hypothetical protein